MSRSLSKNIAENQRKTSRDNYSYLHCIIVGGAYEEMLVDVMVVNKEPVYNSGISRTPIYEEKQIIVGVPVADVMRIRVIPEPGMHGILKFHDTDIENYWDSRAISEPKTARYKDYADAVFIPSEITNLGIRPDPYITIGCDFVHVHTDLQVDGDVYTKQQSLNDLGLSYSTHTHAVSGTVTLVPNDIPVPPIQKECPSIG